MSLEKLGGGNEGNKITPSDTAPQDPSEGDKWIDTSLRDPAEKVYINGNWVTLIKGNDPPESSVSYSSIGVYTYDVSDITDNIQISLKAENGEHVNEYDRGGSGASCVLYLDLESYTTIEIQIVDGDPGWTPDDGDGGDGVNIYADETLIAVAGGGGGAEYSGTPGGGGDGGGAKGMGGDGGDPISGNQQGDDGNAYVNTSLIEVGKVKQGDSNTVKATLFNQK